MEGRILFSFARANEALREASKADLALKRWIKPNR